MWLSNGWQVTCYVFNNIKQKVHSVVHFLPEITSFIAETHVQYGSYEIGQTLEHCIIYILHLGNKATFFCKIMMEQIPRYPLFIHFDVAFRYHLFLGFKYFHILVHWLQQRPINISTQLIQLEYLYSCY